MHSNSEVTNEGEGEDCGETKERAVTRQGSEERRDKEEEHGEIRKSNTAGQGKRVWRDEDWLALEEAVGSLL